MEKTQYYKIVNGKWQPCEFKSFEGAGYCPLYNDKLEQIGIGITGYPKLTLEQIFNDSDFNKLTKKLDHVAN